MPKTSADETRQLILETARTLLRRFGPGKMTVVDIARAMRMSHANVYRFFQNKSEIIDAIVDEWLSRVEAFVEGIAARPGSAAARIEAVVLEIHRKRREKLLKDAQFYETYRRVVELRPDFVAQRRQKIVNVFQRLLEEGMRSGEFAKVNAPETAVALKDATSLFLHPLLIPTELGEHTEARARRVVRCVLAGLAREGARESPAARGQVRLRIPRVAGRAHPRKLKI